MPIWDYNAIKVWKIGKIVCHFYSQSINLKIIYLKRNYELYPIQTGYRHCWLVDTSNLLKALYYIYLSFVFFGLKFLHKPAVYCIPGLIIKLCKILILF